MPEKELHFFDGQGRFGDRWARGQEWYESQFPVDAPQTVVGEKTPTYSYVPGAAERIHSLYPDVRLIWIFRDPVDRAYSNYWHYVCHAGKETRSFQEAVSAELRGDEKNIWKQYVRRSQYADQVKRFLQLFAKDDMLFLKFMDLKRDIADVLGQTYRFLGVPETEIRSKKPSSKNKTRIPRSLLVRRFVCNVFGRDSLADCIDKKFNRKAEAGYPPMSEDLCERLSNHFETSNRELEAITGLVLSP